MKVHDLYRQIIFGITVGLLTGGFGGLIVGTALWLFVHWILEVTGIASLSEEPAPLWIIGSSIIGFILGFLIELQIIKTKERRQYSKEPIGGPAGGFVGGIIWCLAGGLFCAFFLGPFGIRAAPSTGWVTGFVLGFILMFISEFKQDTKL